MVFIHMLFLAALKTSFSQLLPNWCHHSVKVVEEAKEGIFQQCGKESQMNPNMSNH